MRAWMMLILAIACQAKPTGAGTATDPATTEPVEAVCTDGVDDDADGLSDCDDPDCATICDADGDGHRSPDVGGDDCDDDDPDVNPDAIETCNGVDDDCDGMFDDDDPDVDVSDSPWYADRDGDGFGDGDTAIYQCAPPTIGDTVQVDGDCDDLDPQVNPAVVETCNNRDDDCDGLVDDDDPSLDPTGARTWYADADGDGYGDALTATIACARPPDHVEDDSDCDDSDPTLGPPVDWWLDADGDGFGDGPPVNGCAAPAPDWSRGGDGDCNDGNAAVHPGAYDVCGDGVDSNCDGDDCTVCTQIRVGLLPGWGSGFADPNLEWVDMQVNQAQLGTCPIAVVDVPDNFTQTDLDALSLTVLWSGDAAGGTRQYSPGELAAIQGWVAAGNGGLVTTYLWNYNGIINGDLAALVGVDPTVLLDTTANAQLGVDVLDPNHGLAIGLPTNFNAASYPYLNASTAPIRSSLLPNAVVVMASPDDSNLAIAYDPGDHRGVAFTTFVEYAATSPAVTWQLMYNAAAWASGYDL